MAVVALLVPDPAARARFASSLEGEHRILHAPDLRHLQRLVRRHPVDVCVIDPYDPFASISLQQLRRFRTSFTDVAILVYADFEGKASDLFDLGRLQVDEVLQADERESRGRIRRVVQRTLARSTAARVRRALEGRLPLVALDCLAWAVEHAGDSPRVADLATAIGIPYRVLSRDLRTQDLPSGRALLLWGRLLLAARLLESGTSTVDHVAYRVGYATGGALRRACKRHCGVPPGQVAGRGGLSIALAAFVTRLAGAEPAPSRPRWSGWARSVR